MLQNPYKTLGCKKNMVHKILPGREVNYIQPVGHILVFFNRHCSTMNLVKEKKEGLVPPGLKKWPFELIKQFTDTTCVLPSPADPLGCCPLNFLNLINLKFGVRAPNGCCIL